MPPKLVRKYKALDGWYAVFQAASGQLQEIRLESEKSDLKVASMQAEKSFETPQNNEPAAIQSQINIMVDGKQVYSGDAKQVLDISTYLRKSFTVSARLVVK